jgi:hypothetical protein
MSDESIVLTREQLYEAVWKGTLKSIAAEHGTSAAELVRACDELDVPRPAAGHWSRVAHGYQEEPPPLPTRIGDVPNAVSLRKLEATHGTPRSAAPDVRIDPQGRLHPVAKAIESAIAGHTDERDGTGKLRGGYDCAVLKVSKAQRKRAVLIFDTLFKACERGGYEIKFKTPGERWGPYELKVRSGGDEIAIGLVERITQTEHKLTPKEAADKKAGGYFWAPRYDHTPSGRFTLRLHARYRALKRSSFSDGTGRKLEDVLGSVVLAIQDGFTSLVRMRQEDEVIAHRQREDEARRVREQKRAEYKEALVQDLRKMSGRWKEAEGLRQFLQAVEERIPKEQRVGDVLAWLDWAKSIADEIDPLTAIERVPKRVELR